MVSRSLAPSLVAVLMIILCHTATTMASTGRSVHVAMKWPSVPLPLTASLIEATLAAHEGGGTHTVSKFLDSLCASADELSPWMSETPLSNLSDVELDTIWRRINSVAYSSLENALKTSPELTRVERNLAMSSLELRKYIPAAAFAVTLQSTVGTAIGSEDSGILWMAEDFIDHQLESFLTHFTIPRNESSKPIGLEFLASPEWETSASDWQIPILSRLPSQDANSDGPTIAVYGTPGDVQFCTDWKLAQERFNDESMSKDEWWAGGKVVLRPTLRRPSGAESSFVSQQMVLSGFGVFLDVKNMEYRNLDETPTSTNNLTDDNDLSVEEEEEEVTVKQVDELSLQTVQRFSNLFEESSLSRWESLTEWISAFPRHVSEISTVEVTDDLRQDAEMWGEMGISRQVSSNSLYVNGRMVPVGEYTFNLFDILSILTEEFTRWKPFHETFQSWLSQTQRQEVISVLDQLVAQRSAVPNGNMNGETKETTDPVFRVNLLSAGRGAIRFINNLEKDSMYASWPSSLRTLLRPAWSPLHAVRRNILTMVLTADPLSLPGAQLLLHSTILFQQMLPVRIGIILHCDENSPRHMMFCNAFQLLHNTDPIAALYFSASIAEVVLGDSTVADSQMSTEPVTTEFRELILQTLAEVTQSRVSKWEAALENANSDSSIREIRGKMQKAISEFALPRNTWLVNGRIGASGESLMGENFLSILQQEERQVTEWVKSGDLREETKTILGDMLRLSAGTGELVERFHSFLSEKSPRYLPLANDMGQYFLSQMKFRLLSSSEEVSNKEETALVILFSDLSSAGITQLRETIVWLRKSFSERHTGVAIVWKNHNWDDDQTVGGSSNTCVADQEDPTNAKCTNVVRVNEAVRLLTVLPALMRTDLSKPLTCDATCIETLDKLLAQLSTGHATLYDLIHSFMGEDSRYDVLIDFLSTTSDDWSNFDEQWVTLLSSAKKASRLSDNLTPVPLSSGNVVLSLNGRIHHCDATNLMIGQACLSADDLSLFSKVTLPQISAKFSSILDNPTVDVLQKHLNIDDPQWAAIIPQAILTSYAADYVDNAKPRVNLSEVITSFRNAAQKYLPRKNSYFANLDYTVHPEEDKVNVEGSSASPVELIAVLDPLSLGGQRGAQLVTFLIRRLGFSVRIILTPLSKLSSMPLQNYFQLVSSSALPLTVPDAEAENTDVSAKSVVGAAGLFTNLSRRQVLTVRIDAPEAWNVQTLSASQDGDNLRCSSFRLSTPCGDVGKGNLTAVQFHVKSLLLAGQCFEVDSSLSPIGAAHGLQLQIHSLYSSSEEAVSDTLVMKNLGYYQLQVPAPGLFRLSIASERGQRIFELVSVKDGVEDQTLESTTMAGGRLIAVHSFADPLVRLFARRRPGMETVPLLGNTPLPVATTEEETPSSTLWSFLSGSFFNSFNTNASNHLTTTKKEDDDEIHVFSLATGHLYERFLRIMMRSAVKQTSRRVHFWLFENFLSPSFKESLPILAEKYSFNFTLITYKWPQWLPAQTNQQRVIWGYKILFLDVLFPLSLKKIIYIDADQILRTDLHELWTLDLDNHPYAYPPFCTSRQETLGYQFWRDGYWKDHLQGKPYHISALYVVDLELFRQQSVGDKLRGIYASLSNDPNSLSNLDQDLPNFAQNEIPIYTLPQDWLWCESWCDDDSKARSKTIDLCNNPLHKEGKLDMAKRVISGELFEESWIEMDDEIRKVLLDARVLSSIA